MIFTEIVMKIQNTHQMFFLSELFVLGDASKKFLIRCIGDVGWDGQKIDVYIDTTSNPLIGFYDK